MPFDGAGVIFYGDGKVISAGGGRRPAELTRSIGCAIAGYIPGGSRGKARGRQNRYILVIRIPEVDIETEVLTNAGDIGVGAGVRGIVGLRG